MAKAVFSKGQRVFVKPVGVWAVIDRILPQWVKGVEEPLRIYYDVGLGREFQAHELQGDAEAAPREIRSEHIFAEDWRLLRMRSRWVNEIEAKRHHHPHPGTYPVVVTDEQDWGGWRVSVSEYDRDPGRIEFQARVFANALKMLRITRELARFGAEYQAAAPDELKDLVSLAEDILSSVYEPEPPQPAAAAV
ncbi:MAG: hypothetical protein AB7M12_04710 [Hyphomonadaceae bacterium]